MVQRVQAIGAVQQRGGGSAVTGLARAGWRHLAGALVLAVAAAGVAAQTAPPSVIEVHAGDTFSAIAARFTGDPRAWRTLYSAENSGLANPNLISVGMRFELLADGAGKRYLKLLGGPAVRSAAGLPLAPPAQAAQAGAPVAAPKPAAPALPAPAPAPAAAPAPTVVAAPTPAPAPAPAPALPAADNTLVIGVLPNLAASTLIPQYENLKRYLERVAGQKVRIVVPGNFKLFFDSMMNGEFDLAVSAPHFARVAQLDRNMAPLVIYEPRINALLIAPIDSSFTVARDLRERALAFANPTSLVAMYGQQWLRQQNLEAGKDYEVRGARTDLGVGRMLLSGDVVAAIMSNGEFRALPPEESSRLKVIEVFARIPNFIVMAHPRLERDRTAKLRAQFKGFLADADDGAAFAKATGFSGMADADEAQLKELDPFVALTRRAMGVAK